MLGTVLRDLQNCLNPQCTPIVKKWALSYIFPFINLFYFILAALGLRCCTQAFSSCGQQGYSSLWRTGFSLWWLLLLRSTGFRCAGFSSCGSRASVVVAHEL